MRGKVIVGDGEDIGAALKRLRREVGKSRGLNKWPVWAGHPATEKQRRRRKRWLKSIKIKWERIRAKQLRQ